MNQLSYIGDWGGRFIVPIPEVKQYNANGTEILEYDLGEKNKMKVVLFCGGLGLRMHPATETVPKPLVPVGEKPILVAPDEILLVFWTQRLCSLLGL